MPSFGSHNEFDQFFQMNHEIYNRVMQIIIDLQFPAFSSRTYIHISVHGSHDEVNLY